VYPRVVDENDDWLARGWVGGSDVVQSVGQEVVEQYGVHGAFDELVGDHSFLADC